MATNKPGRGQLARDRILQRRRPPRRSPPLTRSHGRIPIEISQLLDRGAQLSLLSVALCTLITALYFAQYIFAPATAGIILGFTIGPLVDRLEHWRVPTTLSAALIVLTLVAVIGALTLTLAQPIQNWAARVPEIGLKFQTEFQRLQEPLAQLREMERKVEDAATPGDETDTSPTEQEREPVKVVVEEPGVVQGLLISVPDAMARFVVFLGTLYFLLATRSRLRAAVLEAFATRRSKLRFARITRDTEFLLSRYIFTITGINIVLGIVVATMTYAVGLPSPLLWGAMAGIVNFIPYLGMAFMTVVLAGVGLVTFDTITAALVPALLYLAINGLEGQLITPHMLGRNLTLNPLVVFLAIAFWLWLWGPVGAFLAVPLLIIAAATLYHLAPRVVDAEHPPTFGKPAARAAASYAEGDGADGNHAPGEG